MSTLSDEELAYFSGVFSPEDDSTDNALSRHSLSVATEIPQVLAHILGNAKLTLLAEISYYRLWFPLTLKQDELGQFLPELGIPEVIDMRGGERSWRLNNVKNIKVIDNDTAKFVEVLSLSSSGMTIKVPQELNDKVPRLTQLILPNGVHLDMVFEPVRTENGVMAAKISAEGESREILRQFLFSEHKAKYSHLYKNINR
ncbi:MULTISPECIES: hypothetical protein [unclassified Shewanella]|jgi:hypothetical protein|uniref:hypothetical protein n=1 Tax=unclassified Shewanella TaxID=196818 RepID=UPI000C342CEE|nr:MULTISPECIES: hypothetical protein [unclassified Shewanella]MBB1363525.1 hypothetical protein [Shewanella sp. SR44-4]MBO1896074.1 hypothetical protein [Shewanella sp. BF02_Schw]PKH33563.1 hypothetical protein CXF88_05580 [Shewanella sp. ALD9]QHS12411.1 hypothetical protein GUY17_04420 [Shewanella sp. Arc9-LZ]